MDLEKTTYSNASNARRAAKKAGLSEFDVYKASDNWYKIRPPAAKAAKKATVKGAVSAAIKAGITPKKFRKLAESVADELANPPKGKRAAVLAAAQAGELPPPPDFTAPTHARYRDAAKALVDMENAGDIEGLKATEIKAYSSSPKAMAKYRDLAVIALEARRAAEPEATAA